MSEDMELPPGAATAQPGTVGGFDAIPAGEYQMLITKSEEKFSEKCGGKYYSFTLQVLQGPHKNRQINLMLAFKSEWANDCLTHYANLKAATGVNSARHADFVDKAVLVTVTCYKKKPGGELANGISNIKPRQSGPPQMPAVPQFPTAQQIAAPVTEQAPWGNPV